MAIQTDLFTTLVMQIQLSATYLWKSKTRTILSSMSFGYLISVMVAVSASCILLMANSHSAMLTDSDTASEEGIDPWGR